ncbi:substrate-binding periplasmic protein [Chitinilyticum litopenaei]|uniref:substrate-binding periplasmic protein n=1 Tax=Chitinilyticum litopenaei TaxID=1121276 RepID=UPI0003FDB1F1|nr:hypothetical protein [Chitinilyticum litopenaei]
MLQFWPRGLLLALAGLACGPVLAATLRVLVSDALPAPQLLVSNGRVAGGLVWDMSQQIAAEGGDRVEFVLLPRKRLERTLESGDFELACMLNPAWFKPGMPLRWSPPLIAMQNVLAIAPGKPNPQYLSELYGQIFSTVRGYQYPTLEQLFAAGLIQREDAPSEELMLRKLSKGRTAYGVINQLSLRWYNRRQPPELHLGEGLVLANASVSCATPSAHPRAAELHRRILRLQGSGYFEALRQRYLAR